MRNLLLLLLVVTPLHAADECGGERLAINVDASVVSFTVTQGDSPFSGEFRSFGGLVCRDESGLSRVDVWLDPASVDSGLPEVDELLVTPAFFRIDEHPRVTFSSRNIRRKGMLVEATGELAINGIVRNRSVEFRFGEQGDGRWQAKGRFTLPRLAYELGTGEWDNTDYLANEVVIEFDAVLESE